MRILIFILTCILFSSCFKNKKVAVDTDASAIIDSSQTVTNQSSSDIVNSENNKSETVSEAYKDNLDSISNVNYPIDQKLPFGSSVLADYTFPKNGFSYTTDENNSDRTHQEQFYTLVKYYTQLNTQHPDIEIVPSIVFSDIKYIKLANDDFLNPSDLHRINNPTTFTLRLENIGIYEAYFHINETDFEACESEFTNISIETCCYDFETCKEKGFLILYERKTKKAIVLNPYYIHSEDEGTSFRFCHISKNNSIKIYEAYSDVDDYNETVINNQINQTHHINIQDDGNINVNTLYIEELDNDDELTEEEQQEIHENQKVQEQQFINHRDSILSITKPVIVAYPFGAKELYTHQFSNKIFKSEDTDNYNILNSIWNYYLKKNQSDNKLKFLPAIAKYDKIEVDGINQWGTLSSFNDASLSDPFNKPRFNFKLPNISKYEVYYSTHTNEVSNCEISETNTPIVPYTDCNIDGILLLYDKVTQEAHAINAYSIVTSLTQTYFRFFYISDDNQIHIYEGQGNHDFQTLEGYMYDEKGQQSYFNPNGRYTIRHTSTIQISENGEININ